jgi:hypothetical protein
VKRPYRAWAKGIVEVPSRRPDPRSDPQATQKISREQLEDALRRTKSGTRPAVRSEPGLQRDSLPGPRDDEGPEITIVRIDSVELSVIDPASFPPPRETSLVTPSQASPLSPSIVTATPRSLTSSLTRRLHITPRLAFLAGLAVVVFVTLAAVVGFFAGRISH